MIIKYLYTFFLAVILVTFVGVGIAAFYKGPKAPEYPIETQPIIYTDKPTSESAEMAESRIKYEKESRNFQKENESYSKNVSIISLVAALIIMAISIVFVQKILYLSDGLLLGGVFTLVYSVIRGFNAGDEMFRFIVVSVGLAVSVYLGYWKFVRQSDRKK